MPRSLISAETLSEADVDELVKQARASGKLNAVIERAMLGGQSLDDIIAQVGRAIGGDKFTGLFNPLGARAESVALNEILRMHSIAGQAHLEGLARQVPGIKKQWLHVPVARVPRPSHILASGQVREVGQPFSVGGEALMYPRDPNGSPENTTDCHCMLVPYMDPSDLQPTARQKAVLKELGIEISVTR
jgi:hypothetical protein